MWMISRVSDAVGMRADMVGVRGGLDMTWDSEGDRVAGGFAGDWVRVELCPCWAVLSLVASKSRSS